MRTSRIEKLKDNEFCWYCGYDAEDVDHLIPKSRGGKTIKSNLVAACRNCNNCKGNLTVEEFRVYLKQCAARRSTKYTVLKVKPYGFVFYGERVVFKETKEVPRKPVPQCKGALWLKPKSNSR